MNRVRAIAELRFKLMMRRMQGTRGALQVAGAVLLGAGGLAFALFMGASLGIMVHTFARSGEPQKILIGYFIVFYLALIFGILLPMMRGALDQGFDASPFVIYPVRRVRLYGITLAACLGSWDHLLYFPTMLAIAVTGVLLPGNNAPLGLGLIAACVASFVIWGNALSLGVVGVMRARRIREIAGVVGLTLLIGLAFVPAMLDTDGIGVTISRNSPLLRTALSVGAFLPPSIAAEGLTALHRPDGAAAAALGLWWLLVWDAAGLGLGYLIFDRYHLAEAGVKVGGRVKRAEARKASADRWLTLDGPLLSRLPSEVRAVTGKDLRYLFRSVIGRVNLFTAPLLTLLIALFVGRGFDAVIPGLDPERLVLYGMLLYGTMFSSNFFNNTLAWEGDGIQIYYLGPASPRRVFLGKNLALWLYNVILLVLILTTWTIVSGPPDPLTLSQKP